MGVGWEPLHHLVLGVLWMWREGVSHRSLRIRLQREDLDSGLCARDIASFFSPSPCYIQKRIFLLQCLFMKGVGPISLYLCTFSFMLSYTRWQSLKKNHITGGLSKAQSSVGQLPESMDGFLSLYKEWVDYSMSKYILWFCVSKRRLYSQSQGSQRWLF